MIGTEEVGVGREAVDLTETRVVVEWAPFRLKEDVDEAELMKASRAVQAQFLSKQEGLLRRELLKGEGGRWVDIAYWKTHEAADRAAERFWENPVCLAYAQLMANPEDAGADVAYFERVEEYS